MLKARIKTIRLRQMKAAHQIQAGYPGIQHSGNEMSLAPLAAASSMRAHVFCTDFSRSSHSGSACVTATRMVEEDLESAMAVSKKILELQGTNNS